MGKSVGAVPRRGWPGQLTTSRRGYIVPDRRGGRAWTPICPPPSSADLCSGAGAATPRVDWCLLADCLLKHASGQERDDDVQDTLLRLHRRLGPDALLEDAIRLGRFILRRCRIDRLRRRTLELLGDGDDEAVRPMVGDADLAATESLESDPEFTQRLGPSAARLLQVILSGIRCNKAIARVLDSSPSSVRRRRLRLQQSLAALLVDADFEQPR